MGGNGYVGHRCFDPLDERIYFYGSGDFVVFFVFRLTPL